jgi:23S rRNA pseudouridine2605 synthase
MRINKFVASATGLSRRAADQAVEAARVQVNGQPVQPGQQVSGGDKVTLDGQPIALSNTTTTLILNKPAGYVCSRNGQGSRTVYELLPPEYARLKPVGRLDKDSSGLLLMTDDGELANQLTHPSYGKTKIYEVRLDKPLEPLHQQMINDTGISLEDGPSRLQLSRLDDVGYSWQVTMSEGRNRQIRRTFAALGYGVMALHRTNFGNYSLEGLASGKFKVASNN